MLSGKTLTLGKKKKVELKINPDKAKMTITYKSSNKKVATVNKKGVITPKKKGHFYLTIKVKSKNTKTKKIKMVVKKKSNKVTGPIGDEKYYIKKRTKILKELGITDSTPDQYAAFLCAKWVCDHLKSKHGYSYGQTYEEALDCGTGVCAGYSRLLCFLLDGAKVENHYLSIHDLNHALVEVKIDGQWYNIDILQMDNTDLSSTGPKYAMCNFLASDKYGFYDLTEYGHKCTSHRFDYKMIWDDLKKMEQENYREGYCSTGTEKYNVYTYIQGEVTSENMSAYYKYLSDKEWYEAYPDLFQDPGEYVPEYVTEVTTLPDDNPRYKEETFIKWSYAKRGLACFSDNGYISPLNYECYGLNGGLDLSESSQIIKYNPWFSGTWKNY